MVALTSAGRNSRSENVVVVPVVIPELELGDIHTDPPSLVVKISSSALKESAALKAKAKAKQVRSLLLRVITASTNGKRTTIRVQIKNLGP